MERRKANRYSLSLPARTRGRVEQADVARQGRTRDISTRGVYLVVDSNVKTGAQLDLEVVLTAGHASGTEATIRAVVKVLRVERRREHGKGCVGLAAAIVRYEIVRNDSMTRRSPLERSL